MQVKNMKGRVAGLCLMTAALTAGATLSGCTVTTPKDRASVVAQQESLHSDSQAALNRLYRAAPQAETLAKNAKGVLVFPKVYGGSFMIGAEHGKGELLLNGKSSGYYSINAASFGFQAGAQSRAIIYMFMTQEALNDFRSSHNWSAGADAGVSIADIGANGSIDTHTAGRGIVGFVLNNAGLQGGVSLSGGKINQINL